MVEKASYIFYLFIYLFIYFFFQRKKYIFNSILGVDCSISDKTLSIFVLVLLVADRFIHACIVIYMKRKNNKVVAIHRKMLTYLERTLVD